MENIFKKFAIFLISFLVLTPIVFAQLEVGYPDLPNVPDLNKTAVLLPDYVVYIFVLLIILGVIIAIGALIAAGFKYINSAQNPEAVKDARNQIFAALWGLIILLSSGLILNTINPKIADFSMFNIKKISGVPLPEPKITKDIAVDLLKRLENMTQEIKNIVSNNLSSTVKEIKDLTNECECKKTKSLCICSEGNENSECQAAKCYVDEDSNPCGKNKEKINDHQKKIIFLKDILGYYQHRSVQERADLKQNIEKVVNAKIMWYDYLIGMYSTNINASNTSGDKAYWEEMLNEAKKLKAYAEQERRYKSELIIKLEELEKAIEFLTEPTQEIAALPDRCSSDVGEKCQATCKIEKESGYGCYNAVLGCQPDECTGKNPCPKDEIKSVADEINQYVANIAEKADQIGKIVNSIPKE